jgi:uncharacterized protein YbjT (DUF2867 family)
VAREHRDLEVFVNISQLTVSQMSLTEMTDPQRALARRVGAELTGLPSYTSDLRSPPEPFSDWAAESIAKDCTIQLPFGTGRTSPVDARDVAEVIAVILANPTAHIGKVYELTGPRSQDMRGVAGEFSNPLGRTITYVDIPLEQWRDPELRGRNRLTIYSNIPDYGPPPCRQLLRSFDADIET